MARIADLLSAGPTYSFEFYPPKDDAEHAQLVAALMDLQPLRPSFVSVTYRGGRSSRPSDPRVGRRHAADHHA